MTTRECSYLGPNGDEICELPAAYRFRWPWGAEGQCCAHHENHLKALAGQLGVTLALYPLLTAVPAPEPTDDALPDTDRGGHSPEAE